MAARRTAAALRALARVLRGERSVEAAGRRAIAVLLDEIRAALIGAGMDPAVLDNRWPRWRSTVADDLAPTIEAVFTAAWATIDTDGPVSAAPYATRHLESVWNRLVGVADETFDVMRLTLEEGRRAGESIPELTARVDALLTDEQRWTNRARTIARTEVIAANNAGAAAGAGALSERLGYGQAVVVKEWLATGDARTRPTHADADGQQVLGMDTPFSVGGYDLQEPGDPSGPAEEVVNCRCVALYHMPGDADYPADGDVVMARDADAPPPAPTPLPSRGEPARPLAPAAETPATDAPAARTAAATTQPHDLEDTMDDDDQRGGVVLVALPAPGDPVHEIGPEEKHATLLYLGDIPGASDDEDDVNPGLTDDARTLLSQVAATVAAATGPITETVTGVEPLGDDGAQVWMLAGDALPALRDALLETDTEVGTLLAGVEQYPSYSPHVTIGYLSDDPDVDNQAVQEAVTEGGSVESITFDRLALWWGTSRSEWALVGSADAGPGDSADDTGEDAPMTDTQATNRADGTFAEEPPARADDIAADGDPFYGIIWPEATVSGDARRIGAGASTWRDLPLPLMFQDATAMGHDGAVRVGRIDTLTRDETTYDVPVIRYAGVWDTSEVAREAARQVENGMVRGVSVDGDDVTVELLDSEGRPLDPMVDDFPEDGVVVENATAARICGGTICSVPAFHQAYIANGRLEDRTDPEPGWADAGGAPTPNTPGIEADETPEGPEAVAASAWSLVASVAPVVPARFFSNPGLTQPTSLTVDDDGHVYGHLATWGTCHIGIDGICQEPPVSASNYAFYAKGVVHTDDGGVVHVGPITMGTGHASMRADLRAAVEHYDNTGTTVADVAIGQDAIGIWFSGMVRPGTPPEKVYALRAAGAVSGDWREYPRGSGDLELCASLVVNVPGFPIGRPAVAASGRRATAMVASGIVRPTRITSPAGQNLDAAAVYALIDRRDRTRDATARLDAAAATDRRRRAAAARSRITTHRVAAAAARLDSATSADR